MKSVAHQAVFNQMIDLMEKGQIPWRKPWKNSTPRNGFTNRKYSGINFFILSATEYFDERWFTYKQITELGGTVKKGEKSRQIVYWNILKKEQDGKSKSIPLLKYFNVFNFEQTEGIVFSKEDIAKLEEIRKSEIIEAETIVKNYADKPVTLFSHSFASYTPINDTVKMPPKTKFNSVEEFYCTLFHEYGHSTGHEKRLNRKGIANITSFGSESYSEEELIAEFTAAFLCNYSGIDNTLQNSAAYIQGWMKAFKSNPEMIVLCANKAQKATEYILGIKPTQSETV
jgi:antirestriction protein ArdC